LVITLVPVTSHQPKLKRIVTLLLQEGWYSFVLLVLLAIGVAAGVPLTRATMRAVNSARLQRFAHQIAGTDQIRAAALSSPVPVHVSLYGHEAKRVVDAISAAKRDTASYANIWGVKIRFQKGTNVLAEIKSSGNLFLVSGKQYRDDTGALRDLAVMPAYDASSKEQERQRMSR
jgi:hypothetical protein